MPYNARRRSLEGRSRERLDSGRRTVRHARRVVYRGLTKSSDHQIDGLINLSRSKLRGREKREEEIGREGSRTRGGVNERVRSTAKSIIVIRVSVVTVLIHVDFVMYVALLR